MTSADAAREIVVLDAGARAFRETVAAGLRRRPRTLPCKYFYDERGSRLFDRVCELPEYYLTRAELGILRRHAAEIALRLGPACLLIELGSGSSLKTRVLLDRLLEPAGYVPVDISREYLRATAAAIAADYPGLTVTPVCADYSTGAPIPLPAAEPGRAVIFFPGSSLGNFDLPGAGELLARIRRALGPGGRLLIGIDLKKDPAVIERAYNDASGVTAEFNRNLLVRINRELGADFALAAWHHHAFYEPVAGRIEMHLVSRAPQRVRLDGESFEFAEGESIRTECSYKYTVEEFLAMARGFAVESIWTDPERWFAVLLLRAGRQGPEEASDV